MNVSYEGIGQWAATFACDGVSAGQVVKVSGSGTVGTHFRPFACCRVAISPLYHIKDFLTISRHLRHWYATLLTAIAFGISS